MDSKTFVDYAVKRIKHHVNRFTHLYEMLKTGPIDESWLRQLEQIDNLFPDLDYRVYQSQPSITQCDGTRNRPRILMLSWEFPPMTVGGLSRHVYDLSRYLVRNGWDVHVITTEIGEYPHYEVAEGVHVHRVHVLKPDGGEFVHWAFQLNLIMIDTCQALIESGLKFDLIHAHDWLVSNAARALKEMYQLPLVSTIHATEHGRNQGIYTDLQRSISSLEWKLTYESRRVILCSNYMRQEVESLFQLPSEKLDVIPNGVDPELLTVSRERADTKSPYALEHERIVLFVGRLVWEKGVHTLLEAAPSILAEHPDVKFVIVGKGPVLSELEQLTERLGIREKVLFAGFISDEERNRLFQTANVAVFPSLYEPFGIVALEAMAAMTPVVVSDVGGLADVVDHGRNGLKMYAGDVHSLSLQVREILRDSNWARHMAETAFAEIGNYDWNRIAQQTIEVYRRILGETETQCEIQEIASAAGRVESDESSDYGRRKRDSFASVDMPFAKTDGTVAR